MSLRVRQANWSVGQLPEHLRKGRRAMIATGRRFLQDRPNPTRGLRRAIRNGGVAYGPFVRLGSPQVVEIAAYAGFYFAILDTELGPLGFETMENLVRAAGGAGIALIVRACESTLVTAIIGGPEGITRLNEIISASVPDMVFIGPCDLSQSMGLSDQIDSPEVIGEMQRVAQTVRHAGLAVGAFGDCVESARRWVDFGVQLIAFSLGVGISYAAMTNVVGALRAA